MASSVQATDHPQVLIGSINTDHPQVLIGSINPDYPQVLIDSKNPSSPCQSVSDKKKTYLTLDHAVLYICTG
uniref:Uncharacterized protein n=1 Tax=Anguilla anguilla TaxID=7936 RepID=A0A0E9U7F1_ANGAN